MTVRISIPGIFFVAWIVMLAMGALHHSVDHHIPAPGYWVTLLVCWAITLLASLIILAGHRR